MQVYNIIKQNLNKIDSDTRIQCLDYIKSKINDKITGIYDIDTAQWETHIQGTHSLSNSYKQYILSHNQFSTIQFFDEYKPYDIYYNKCRCSFIYDDIDKTPGIMITPYFINDINNTPTKFWFKPVKTKTQVCISFLYKTLANDIEMYININDVTDHTQYIESTNSTQLKQFKKIINLQQQTNVQLGFIFNSEHELKLFKPRIYKVKI